TRSKRDWSSDVCSSDLFPRPVDGDASGRHVAGVGQLDEGILGRDVVQAVALLPQELDGRVVELDLREHLLVADPTAGVGVRLLQIGRASWRERGCGARG